MLRRAVEMLNALDERFGVYRAKRIAFAIDGKPAELIREWWTGRLAIRAGGNIVELQKRFTLPPRLLSTTQRWSSQLLGHDVVIEAKRKLPIPALRSTRYRISVDGAPVVDESLRF